MYSLAPNLEEEEEYEAGPHLIAMMSYMGQHPNMVNIELSSSLDEDGNIIIHFETKIHHLYWW